MDEKIVKDSPSLAKELVNDCISRQAAIEAVSKGCQEWRGIFGRCEENILALPPVQPEIIRCRDCKHYKRYEYTGDFACHYVIGGTVRREPDDFCSRVERREVSE